MARLSSRAGRDRNRRFPGWGTGAAATAFLLLASGFGPARAQGTGTQVPIPEEPSLSPQLEVAGVGVVTLDAGTRGTGPGGERTGGSQINVSDSALLLGAAQQLYNGGVGSFSLGGLTLHGANEGGGAPEFFLHQAFLALQGRTYETYLGRTNQPTVQLVQFPTLREEDLITFTHLLNPFSSGDNDEEHRYSNVAAVTLNRKLTHFFNFHAQHLLNSAALGNGGSGLNSYGLTYQYLSPPELEQIQRFITYGAGFESRNVGRTDGGRSNALYGGAVFNLRRSLVRRIDLRVLGISTFGNDLNAFRDQSDTFRANSNSVAASVRYLKTPFGLPGSQLALTVGYKSYPKVSNASSYGLALTGVKRLGEGFDLVAQYQIERRNGALAAVTSGRRTQQAVQVGFVFNFDSTFNRHIGPRRSLLNLQHQYIPQF